MQLPDLESLRCFVLVARTLNFRAAAKAAALTPAALGQRIRKLEDTLGAPLFHRTTRRVALTEAGLALLPQARATLAAAEDCLRAAQGDLGPVPMDLVLGTRHELGLSWLVPLLPALRAALPGVTFHLYFGSGPDLELRTRTQEIDCAISSRRLTDPALDFVRLHREDYAFVGSPALLAQIPLSTPEDAARHTLIDTSAELPLFRYWRDAPGGQDSLAFGRLLSMGTIAAIEALVVAGEGVAVLPRYLVAPKLESGALVEVMPHVVPLHDAFRLLFRADDPRRTVFTTLADALMRHPLQ